MISLAVANQSSSTQITRVEWRQVSGPPVSMIQNGKTLVAFVIPLAGHFVFDGTAFFEDGSSKTTTLEFNATVGSLLKAQVLIDRSVISNEPVSLRVIANTHQDFKRVSWSNTSKLTLPELKIDHDHIYFNAPVVQKETMITLVAEVLLNSGERISDQVNLLIKPASPYAIQWTFFPEQQLTETFAYHAASPWGNTLRDCVYSNQLRSANSCTFEKLPLISRKNSVPSVSDVLDHLVVSHTWMGDRFKEFLETHDDSLDFRRMLGNVTAVVIASDIEQSSYRYYTGAIYLKPDYFALTPDERRTILFRPPHTDKTGQPISTHWRYSIRNNTIPSVPHYDSEKTVSFEQMELPLARALYHELAHATDYISPAFKTRIPLQLSPFDLLEGRLPDLESTTLSSSYPLSEPSLLHLASRYFSGEPFELNGDLYTLAELFEVDGGTDLYAHLNAREDLAMLFEEIMMQIRFGAKRDVAFSNNQKPGVVVWGQRGRIGAPHILPRASKMLGLLRPDLDAEIITSSLIEPPSELNAGSHWLDTANYPPTATPEGFLPEDLDIPQR